MRLRHTIYTHEKFTEQNLHWCPKSEEYAAGSHLIAALRSGWNLAEPRIKARQVWRNGRRPLTLYHFALTRGHQTMLMPVLSNPYVERYIIQHRISVAFERAPDSFAVPQ